MEAKFAAILKRQLELAEKLYGEHTRYRYYLDHYELWHKVDPKSTQKHSTHDSVFFISDEGGFGFKVIKFYNDGVDYRVYPGFAGWAEAYNAGMDVLQR